MSENQTSSSPARVVAVRDEYHVVLNRGEGQVRRGQRFLIYGIGQEVLDIETGESLGRLEVVRGTGVVTHVQEKICTVRSDRRAPTQRRTMKNMSPFAVLSGKGEQVVEEEPGADLPFDDPANGDYAKPV